MKTQNLKDLRQIGMTADQVRDFAIAAKKAGFSIDDGKVQVTPTRCKSVKGYLAQQHQY